MGVQPESVPALKIAAIPRTVPLEITTPRSEFDLLGKNLDRLQKSYQEKLTKSTARLKLTGRSESSIELEELPSGVTLAEPSDSSQTQGEDQTQNRYILACINYLAGEVDWLKQYRNSGKSLEEEKLYCARISNYVILEQYVDNDFIDEFLEVEERQFGDLITADEVEEDFLFVLRGETQRQLLRAGNNSSRDCLFL